MCSSRVNYSPTRKTMGRHTVWLLLCAMHCNADALARSQRAEWALALNGAAVKDLQVMAAMSTLSIW